VPVTVSDAQSRSSTANLSYMVVTTNPRPACPPGASTVTLTNLVSDGAVGLATNSVRTFTFTGTDQVVRLHISGRMVTQTTATFQSEAQFRITPPGGAPITVIPSTNAANVVFADYTDIAVNIPGLPSASGVWTIESFESFNDSGIDTVWPSICISDEVLSNPQIVGNPASGTVGGSVLLTANVTSGANPASLSYTVTGNLSTIGGSGSQAFYDDGSHGDAVAGDLVFSYLHAVPHDPAQAAGNFAVPVSVIDDQSRSGNGSIAVTLGAEPTGACCNGTTCSTATSFNCLNGGGSYSGNGSSCTIPGYNITASSGVYVDISGTGTLAAAASECDDCTESVAIPFTFNFFGNDFTSVNISSNANLQFGATPSTQYINDTIPSAAVPNNGVYPMWDDMNTLSGVNNGAGSIYYQTDGVAPNRTFTVNWSHVSQYTQAGAFPLTDENFEVILYEGSNNIEYRYGTVTASCTTGANQCAGTGLGGNDRTVGVENSTGTVAYSVNGNVVASNTALMVNYLPPVTCAPATGSCCTNNTCTITTSTACAGTWTAGGLCSGASSCNNGHFCGSADFNCDGDLGTDSDISAFFACLSGNCPALPCISNADFNGDGDIGTDTDIGAFFCVLSGGAC